MGVERAKLCEPCLLAVEKSDDGPGVLRCLHGSAGNGEVPTAQEHKSFAWVEVGCRHI